MAHGDKYNTNPELLHVVLVDAATGTVDGPWVDLGYYRNNLALHVDGISTATITVAGSSTGNTAPAASDNGDQIGANITTDGHFTISQAPRWIKGRVTVYTSGTISLTLLASRNV